MEYSNLIIDELLGDFKKNLGLDFEKYRNHVYRVFLNCKLIDSLSENEEKYAVAAVFHDIGIWTDYTIDYIDPSITQALIYLTEVKKVEWSEEITAMIKWHHKISSYKGENSTTINTFRKADWIDVWFGLLSFGVNRKHTREIRKALPNRGFHLFLAKKVGANLFHNPLNPLPMFKK
jgi:hypothetical protein